jgi:hypothetical protein
MQILSGQALRFGGRLCCTLLAGLMTLLLATGLGLSALSWRLAEGPLHLPVLTRAVEHLIASAKLERNIEVQDIVLAWDGFHAGSASPFSVRVSGIQVRDETGALRHELPDVSVTLSLSQLLSGSIAPNEVTIRDPRIVLERDQNGVVSLAMGHLAEAGAGDGQGGELLGKLLGTENDPGLFASLRTIVISGGHLTILDRQLNLTWDMRDVGINLRRIGRIGAEVEGTATLVLPGQNGTVPVRISGRASGTGPTLEGHLVLPEVEPARLAKLMPALAPLGLIDALVSLDIHGSFDTAAGTPAQLSLDLRVGAGSVALAPERRLRFAGLEVQASGSPEELRLDRLALTLPMPAASRMGAAPTSPVITAAGRAALQGGRWKGSLQIGLNRIEAAELPAYWPPELGPHAREWVLENLTAGTMSGGQFALAAESAEDLSGFVLKDASGTMRVDRATVHWLRPIPPMENIAATLRLGLKEITIQADTGRQSGTNLTTPGTTIRLFALDTNSEQLEITGRLRGPVAEAVAVIRHPRLKLFEKRPLELKEPGGQIDATIRLAFPLLVDIPDEAIRVAVQAKLTGFRMADVVAGQRLERGTVDLNVDKAHLRATGNAQVGGIPARLAVDMDFRDGPANQMIERVQASAQTDLASLQRLGLDLEGLAQGPVAIEALLEKRRTGDARVNVRADLRGAEMTLTPLAWRKPPGQPATAQAELRLAGDTLRGLESLRVEAPQFSLRGSGSFTSDNRLERLQIAEAIVGQSRFAGEVRPPLRPGTPLLVRLNGPLLDLGPVMDAPDPVRQLETTPAADVVVDARFERVLLGGQRFLTALRGEIRADGDGVLRQARLAGRVGATVPFELAVTPSGAGRDLKLTSDDAGALLAAFDVVQQIRGGRMSIDGHWATNRADAVMNGTAELQDFVVMDAPVIGKLLQTLTIYGVFDALRGPGLNFSQLTAPFTLTPRMLTVRDARAFSASLGLTLQGNLDRERKLLDMKGTVVPAYALNTALGRLPLIGRLFSLERGGGLFAMSFAVKGPLADPQISTNPLSILTPGMLRGLFGGGRPDAP